METREAIALPVLAEAGHIVEVVGAEVEHGGPCVACGRGGKEERRQREDDEDGEVPGAARGPGPARRRRRTGYVVTSTAA